ncbi:HTH-type transcriptional regulator BetI [Streptomyces sp. YIM 130001]|uniref:TetR/AcrR family transcriptional regulator n=1 Tax=Streptomyces sp. YIM 130001 TaxID=2259644 RepID=UPI000E6532F0|nr:TetR/AcrR family transcriptional regulator [Streptomyces sp. YIM 130001]RII14731.1 HTH-type transcriptional regulator BetI [Streptomyces sp. YIM 130001]
MPTGVAMRDVRRQLFDAAERVLLSEGPSALTSRAVTDEAGCAKGVLHRHFADCDAFLAELVRDRIARIEGQSDALVAAAGAGDVVDRLTRVLTELFGSVAVAVVGLVVSRDTLRTRLRETTPVGIPVLTEATAVVASYLDAERKAGRLAPEADVGALAPMLVGTAHLLFADRLAAAPGTATVHRAVAGVLSGVLPTPDP